MIARANRSSRSSRTSRTSLTARSSHVSRLALLGALGAASLTTACGSESAVVGAECADGYLAIDAACVPKARMIDPGAPPVPGLPGSPAYGGPSSPSGSPPSSSPTPSPSSPSPSGPTPPITPPDTTPISPDGPLAPDTPIVTLPPEISPTAPPEPTPPLVIDPPPDVVPHEDEPTPPIVCPSGTAECLGACIPMDSDPLNCGACGKVCPSNLCIASECQGATPGDVVVIGHDYTSAWSSSAQARLLVNALSIPTTNPIRILSFEAGAPNAAVTAAKAIAKAELSRKTKITVAKTAAELASLTLAASYDVVLLHGAGTFDPTMLGATWHDGLSLFTEKGGVVIALDRGVDGMPALLSSAGLLGLTGHATLPLTTHLLVAAPGDTIGTQVLTPYAAHGSPVSLLGTTESEDLRWVVRAEVSGVAADPVVVHRVVR